MRKIIIGFAALLLTVVVACSKKNSTPDTSIATPTKELDFHKYAIMGLDSPFISIDTGNIMLNSYLNSIQNRTNEVKSFIVDADALRYYLQNTNIKHVKLMLAHKLSYVRGGNANQYAGMDYNAMTMIIAGFGSDYDYIYSPQGAVMDFSIPCPNSCPGTGTAGQNTLQ
ncbi:hypothetical protein [Polluticoccus soli]|uniref:hypothetical protein n=1 Tax=Polluticoccus soli TaxID=3034150 RepID=UPI0023E1D3FA|nr:hypothetical protein [Flavipsychrobacter sp. JY13-12]